MRIIDFRVFVTDRDIECFKKENQGCYRTFPRKANRGNDTYCGD